MFRGHSRDESPVTVRFAMRVLNFRAVERRARPRRALSILFDTCNRFAISSHLKS